MIEAVKTDPTLDINAIKVGERTRKLSPANVQKIKKSIEEIGLLHPILVWRDEVALKLVAGRHRLEALKELGWENVPIRLVTTESAAEAMLAEIDENLAREELGATEFGINVKRRERAFLDKKGAHYGETFANLADLQVYEWRKQGPEARKDREGKVCTPNDSFISDRAEKSGKCVRTIKAAKKRGALPDVETLKDTAADNGVALDALVTIQEEKGDEAAAAEVAKIAQADEEKKAAEEEALEARRKAKEAEEAAERAKEAEAKKAAEEEAKRLREEEAAAKLEAEKTAEAVKKVLQEVKDKAKDIKTTKKRANHTEAFLSLKEYLGECENTFRRMAELLPRLSEEELKSFKVRLRDDGLRSHISENYFERLNLTKQ